MTHIILFYDSSEFTQGKVKEALLPEGYVLCDEPWPVLCQQTREIANQFYLLITKYQDMVKKELITKGTAVGFYRPNQLTKRYFENRGFSIDKIALPDQNGESIFCFISGSDSAT